MSLKHYLTKIQKNLEEREKTKEEVQSIMRKATRLSKQAIFFIHQNKIEKAKRMLRETKDLFKKFHSKCVNYPELVHSGIVDAAFEEYAEAQIFLSLVQNGSFVGPEEIDVPPISYVLGLTDVIGELRRRALDSLRKGDFKSAEKCLELMETIYIEVMGMEEAYMLVPGLRRKCDLARRIIETTRGELTIEARRLSLEEAIKRLERKMKTR